MLADSRIIELKREKDECLVINPKTGIWATCTVDEAATLQSVRTQQDLLGVLRSKPGYLGSMAAAILRGLMTLHRQVRIEAPPEVQPRTAYLSLTEECNLRCIYCFARAGQGHSPLPMQEWAKIITDLSDYGVSEVCFTGGEPLTRKDFLRIVEHAGDKQLHLRLITNGTLIDRRIARELARHKVEVTVSLDSYYPEVNNQLRGHHSFQRALQGIIHLCDEGVKLGISAVVNRLTVETIPDLLMLTRALNIPLARITMALFIPMGRGESHRDHECTPEMVRRLRQRLRSEVREWYGTGELASVVQTIKPFPGQIRLWCGGGRSELSIDSRGDLYPCRLLHLPTLKAGNVLREDLVSLVPAVQSKMDQMIQSVNEREECKECPIRYVCGGGCRAGHYAYSGHPNKNSETWCRILRDEFIYILWQKRDWLTDGIYTFDDAKPVTLFRPSEGTCWQVSQGGLVQLIKLPEVKVVQLDETGTRLWFHLVSGNGRHKVKENDFAGFVNQLAEKGFVEVG